MSDGKYREPHLVATRQLESKRYGVAFMVHWLSAVFLLLLFVGSPAAASDARVVRIRVDGMSEFDVVYHRALTNGTGAVIGGLIGAGIQAGIESDKDTAKRNALKPHVTQQIWQDSFVRILNETFVKKGFEPVWTEARDFTEEPKADVYLVIFPDSHGFRLVDSTTMLVSAYVDFSATYTREPAKQPKPSSKESFYFTDKKQASYDSMLKDTSTLNVDLESVLAQAARRLANKIIYNSN